MADSVDPIVAAIERLNETIQIGQRAEQEYYKDLEERVESLSEALGGRTSAKEDNRRGRNAYLSSDRRLSQFNMLSQEQQSKMFNQVAYGVRPNPQTGQFESITNPLSLRKNIADMNLPQVQQALAGGHLIQAGRMFVTGLERTPYADIFAVPGAIRGAAVGLDAARNRVIAERMGQPNALGMATGARGPGVQDLSGGLGSFMASLTAFPSMFASKTGEPFSLFGGSLPPAMATGYKMRKEAFMRSLNPFSMMGYQQNLDLIEATGSKGFGSLATTFKISDVVRDVMQTVGIDAGTVLDTLDVAVKRLHMDTGEAAKQMKEFGGIATSAGKGVAQFAKETFEVLNQMTLGGGKGGGSLMASALMSSIPQVSGPGVYAALTSPTVTGLALGQMAGQGANMQDMMTMALGYPMAVGGGQQTLGMSGNLMQSFYSMAQMFTGTMGKQAGIAAAASAFGISDYMAAERMYNQAPRFMKEAKALQKVQSYKDTFMGAGSPALSYMLGGRGKNFGKTLRGRAKESFSQFRDSFSRGGAKIGSMGMITDYMGGITLTEPSGGNSLEFNQAVNRIVGARKHKVEDEDTVMKDLMDKQIDYAAASQAADMIIAAGEGDTKQYARLATEFGMEAPTTARAKNPLEPYLHPDKYKFRSDIYKGPMNKEAWEALGAGGQKAYKTQASKIINKLTQGKDAILQKGSEEYKYYMDQIKSGQFDFNEFQKDIISRGNLQTATQDRQGRPIVALTTETIDLIGGAVKRNMANKPGSGRPNP